DAPLPPPIGEDVRMQDAARREPTSPRDAYPSQVPARPRNAPAAPTKSNVLGVFGLSVNTRERDLEDVFTRIGEVDKVVVVYDQRSERSRGFAFVTMRSEDDAEKAIADLNGQEIDGRRVRVDYSLTTRPHRPTPGEYMGYRRDEFREGAFGGGGARHYDNRRPVYRDDRRDDRYSSRSYRDDRPHYDDRRGDYRDDRRRDYYDDDRRDYDDRPRRRYSPPSPPRRRSESPRRRSASPAPTIHPLGLAMKNDGADMMQMMRAQPKARGKKALSSRISQEDGTVTLQS
ncbi:uncharacterized protein L969DRAFT_42659, partial [Mixia osmundae IAM 14324]